MDFQQWEEARGYSDVILQPSLFQTIKRWQTPDHVLACASETGRIWECVHLPRKLCQGAPACFHLPQSSMMVFGGKGCWQLRSVTFKMDCLGRKEFLSSSGLEGDGCVFIICKQFISHWVCYSSQKPVCHVEHTTEARRALWGSPWSQHTVEGSGPGPVCWRDPSQAWRLLYMEKKWWSVIIYRWMYAPGVLKVENCSSLPIS